MLGGVISEKFNKFNLIILLPFIYIVQIILPVHLISGAKYHYVNYNLAKFATPEEIKELKEKEKKSLNDADIDKYSKDILYDKSIPTDISLQRRELIYKKCWEEVMNILKIINPLTYLPKNAHNFGIDIKSSNKIDETNKDKKFTPWQDPVCAQGLIIICFIINILIMKFYWKKECLKF